jgi:Domain of Unknown Function (DUF349)
VAPFFVNIPLPATVLLLSLRAKKEIMSETMYYTIQESSIYIPATAWFKERCIAAINESNKDYIIGSLEERFAGLVQKVEEIEARYSNAAEETKLDGLIARTRTYICTAIAIGDYTSLLTRLDAVEAQIKDNGGKVIEQKEAICVQAEALFAAEDSKEAAQQMKELQQQFRNLPVAFDEKSTAIRNRFETACNGFFNRRKQAFDALEQEMAANLQAKIQLCEKAEELQHSTEWKAATETYQQLNEEWKKIGFVPRHRRDEIWQRFNAAKDVFFARKKENFETIKTEQEENYAKKLELVAKAEALQDSTDWKQTSEAYKMLMEEWKKAGWVGQEKSDEVWNSFLAAQNIFYKNKDAHYSKIKTELDDNYARKMALVTHAEALQHSEDFDTATQEFMDMFEEWKKIGRIAREHGDGPWERFIAAKKSFFDRKDAYRAERKTSILKELEERMFTERGQYNKLSRQLETEEQLILDVNERIANLPTSLRSYQKREEYLETLEELKANVASMQQQLADLRYNIQQDEREIHYLKRPFKKKEAGEKAVVEAAANEEAPDQEQPAEMSNETAISDKHPAIENGHQLEVDESLQNENEQTG